MGLRGSQQACAPGTHRPVGQAGLDPGCRKVLRWAQEMSGERRGGRLQTSLGPGRL